MKKRTKLSIMLVAVMALVLLLAFAVNAESAITVTYEKVGGGVLETAVPNEDGTYTLRSSGFNTTQSSGENSFLGWFTADGKVYEPGEAVTFTKNTKLYEAWGIETDKLEITGVGSGNPTYIRLLNDVVLDTSFSVNWTCAIFDLNGHTLTVTSEKAFHMYRGSLAIVGDGTVNHTASTGNLAFASYQAHGYADMQNPQLLWIGEEVSVNTNGVLVNIVNSPNLSETYSNEYYAGLPNIDIYGRVNASALLKAGVTYNATCNINKKAQINLSGDCMFINTDEVNTWDGNYLTFNMYGGSINMSKFGSLFNELALNKYTFNFFGGTYYITSSDADVISNTYLASGHEINEIDGYYKITSNNEAEEPDDDEPDKPTQGGNAEIENITSFATVTSNSTHYAVTPEYLVDGDRKIGSSVGATASVQFIFNFGGSVDISKILIVTNGGGTFPSMWGTTVDETTKNNYNIVVSILDADGNELYKSDTLNSITDANENNEVIVGLGFPISGNKVTIDVFGLLYDARVGIWEVEIYGDGEPHTHEMVLISQTQPTHTEEGRKTYECAACGYQISEKTDAIGHTFTMWENSVNDDYHTHSCDCGVVENQPHGYENGICYACQKVAPTFEGYNIAPDAEISTDNSWWGVYTAYLTDGNWNTGCGVKYVNGKITTTYMFNWYSDSQMTTVAMVVNGFGDIYSTNYSEINNFNQKIKIVLYNDNGETVYESDDIFCQDKTVVALDVNCVASTMELVVVADGYAVNPIFEVEVYSPNQFKPHEHNFVYDSTIDPTHTEQGYIYDKCTVCGKVQTETVPATGHSFGEWQNSKDGACHERVCDCGAIESKAHGFISGICITCGSKISGLTGFNIAADATIDKIGQPWWADDPRYLIDGRWDVACLVKAFPRGWTVFEFKWYADTQITDVVLVVNGTGNAPLAGMSYPDGTNNDYKVEVILYNSYGEVVYNSGAISCLNKTYIKIPVNCEASTMEFHAYSGNWSVMPIFEVEVYSPTEFNPHTHQFEHIDTIEATHTAQGNEIYKCTICGKQKTTIIPVIPHSFGNWQPSDNLNFHTAECECGEIKTQGHAFVDGVCTICQAELYVPSGSNIAPSATVTTDSTWWGTDAKSLVDGVWETATLTSIRSRYTTYTLEWYDDNYIKEISLLVNGKGQAPTAWIYFDEPTNNNFTINIALYNKAGELVYSANNLTTYNVTSINISADVEASRMVLTVDGKWSYMPIFEVEVYTDRAFVEHEHSFEITEICEPTHAVDGYQVYTCIDCGCQTREVIPQVGHSYYASVAMLNEMYHTSFCSCGDRIVEKHVFNNNKCCCGFSIITDTSHVNIAGDATASMDGNASWVCTPEYINDGDRTMGSAASHSGRTTVFVLTFDETREISKAVIVVNGVGSFPADKYFSYEEATKNNYNFVVTFYENDILVYESVQCNSINDANANNEVIINLGGNINITSVKITIDSFWNNSNGLWEVELYGEPLFHECSFGKWTEINDAAHQRKCICGLSETVNHVFGEGVVTKAPTHSEKGLTTYTCVDCGFERAEAIAKQGHNYTSANLGNGTHHKACDCGEDIVESHVWSTWTQYKNNVNKYVRTCICGAEDIINVNKENNKAHAKPGKGNVDKDVEITGSDENTKVTEYSNIDIVLDEKSLNAIGIQIDPQILEAINGSETKITTDIGNIILDAIAMDKVCTQNGDVSIGIEEITTSNEQDAGKRVFSITVNDANGNPILAPESSETNGTVTLSFKYHKGLVKDQIKIAYRNDDGELEYMEVEDYDSATGEVKFKTKHLSDYEIFLDEVDPSIYINNMFEFKGYSVNMENGEIKVGYSIDYEAIENYEFITGKKVNIGAVFASYELLQGQNPLDDEGNAIELNDGYVITMDLSEHSYINYDFALEDLSDSLFSHRFVIAAYVATDDGVTYYQSNGASKTVSGISYTEANAIARG